MFELTPSVPSAFSNHETVAMSDGKSKCIPLCHRALCFLCVYFVVWLSEHTMADLCEHICVCVWSLLTADVGIAAVCGLAFVFPTFL